MKTTRKLLALLLTLILFVGIFAGCGKKPEEEATTTTPETTEAVITTEAESTTEAPTEAPTTTTTSPQTTKAPSTTKKASAPPATQAPAPTQPPAATQPATTEIHRRGVYGELGVANDAEYQALVNQVANYKCPWCGNHNCPCITYYKDDLGNYTTYGVVADKCPEVSKGNAKCPMCGKIITSDFNKVLSDPDTYCIGIHTSVG